MFASVSPGPCASLLVCFIVLIFTFEFSETWCYRSEKLEMSKT